MTSSEKWIQAGYHAYAHQGEAGLKVEVLAKSIGISKSSFYHHFADQEVLVEALFEHHLKQVEVMALAERHACSIDPELIQILLHHREDLLFNRQLRIHQHLPQQAQLLQRTNALFGNEFVLLLARELGITTQLSKIEHIYGLALENFFLQINEQNLEEGWLRQYFIGLKSTTKQLLLPLDGSV